MTISNILGTSILTTLMMLFSVAISAAQVPDPVVSKKESIDNMHHELHDDQAPFKAREALALKELNEMTILEGVSIEDVNAKIDELMAAKNQIMRLRYDHLIKMRAILTVEQKVGYDKAVLNRSEVK